MDIAAGDTGGRDAVRSQLRAAAANAGGPSDAEMQDAWDAAVDACSPWIRPGYIFTPPAGVIAFVTNVAAHVWRVRDSGGDIQTLPDGTVFTGPAITAQVVRRYAVLAGRYATAPRTVAG